jgi:hypothetical protein
MLLLTSSHAQRTRHGMSLLALHFERMASCSSPRRMPYQKNAERLDVHLIYRVIANVMQFMRAAPVAPACMHAPVVIARLLTVH